MYLIHRNRATLKHPLSLAVHYFKSHLHCVLSIIINHRTSASLSTFAACTVVS